MQMIGISIHFTLAASWPVCNGCISNVSREWRAIFRGTEFVICHSVCAAPWCQDLWKLRPGEREREREEVNVNEFTLSMFKCLSPGCGSADRLGVMGQGPPQTPCGLGFSLNSHELFLLSCRQGGFQHCRFRPDTTPSHPTPTPTCLMSLYPAERGLMRLFRELKYFTSAQCLPSQKRAVFTGNEPGLPWGGSGGLQDICLSRCSPEPACVSRSVSRAAVPHTRTSDPYKISFIHTRWTLLSHITILLV